MNHREYEQKKRECWLDTANYCGFSTTDNTKRSAFDSAFDRAYALGQQESEEAGEEIYDLFREKVLNNEFLTVPNNPSVIDRYLEWSKVFKWAVNALGKQFGNSEQLSAEGEEMLTVSRKRVQKIYIDYCAECDNEEEGSANRLSLGGRLAVLQELFGSKCLPDLSEVKRSLSENLSEQKPAEPKFKLKDRVVRKYVSTIRTIVGIDSVSDETGTSYYYMTEDSHGNNRIEFLESDLEPYTEPDTSHETPVCENHSDNTSQKRGNVNSNRNLSQFIANCDNQFDNILKDSFRNDRRLNIAAQIASGICSSPNCVDLAIFNRKAEGEEHIAIAQYAIKIADALIAECEKEVSMTKHYYSEYELEKT